MIKKIALVGIIVAALLSLYRDLGFTRDLPSVREFTCKYLEEQGKLIGSQDLVLYDNKTLITGSNDNIAFWEMDQKPEPGQIGVIYEANTAQPVINIPELRAFPYDKLAFYPHGIYLRNKNQLYVLNHGSYDKGGERVQLFSISGNSESHSLVFTWQGGIKFSDQYIGTLNDFIVISDSKLFITQYLPFPMPKQGQNAMTLNSILYNVQTFLSQAFKLQWSYVLKCENFNFSQEISNVQCQTLQHTAAIMNNGITWDLQNTVYVSQTFDYQLTSYYLDNQNHESLTFIQDIPLDGMPDNVQYNSELNILTAGTIMRPIDHLNFVKKAKSSPNYQQMTSSFWGGISLVDLNQTPVESSLVISGTSIIQACSAGILLKGGIAYFGSWADQSIAHCDLNGSLGF